MKRENYLKPQTVREQVALEQGICVASIVNPAETNVAVKSTAQGYNEIDAEKYTATEDFPGITWE
jgi:hypothetical protein